MHGTQLPPVQAQTITLVIELLLAPAIEYTPTSKNKFYFN